MAPPGVCPQCGVLLPADAAHGICPKCLLGLGFDEPAAADSQRGLRPTLDPAGRFTPPTPADLALHFPQLEIVELLGQGGMGAVYLARQKTLDRLVALKILPPEVGQDPAFAERFTREAQALARLTHPNIVMVFDFGETDGYYFFLMEYVDGVNLRQSLQAGRLTPEQALTIVPQVCEALQYAHDQGLVHRDIKPENVLLDKRGRVKIADFGLAKLLGRSGGRFSLTGTGQVMGTPHYMAPEQMEKPLSVDHRADIYSLGVVFYELLTGELPIGRFAPPSEKTNVSADLDQVVLRTLEKEPNRRYQQASEVKTAVESLSGEQGYAGRAAAIAPHTQRLHVPFAFDDVYGGWARADGILRFDGRELTLEFQVKDSVVGCMTSGVKTVSVRLADVISLKLVTGWLGWNPMLELRTDKLLTLRDIPGRAGGVVRLAIARSDLELARQVAEAVNTAIAPAVPAVALAARTAKPPLPGEGIRWQKIAHDVRGPATGLMIVGILDCVTMLLLFMVIPVFRFSRVSDPPQSIQVQAIESASNSGVVVTTDGARVLNSVDEPSEPRASVGFAWMILIIVLVPLAFAAVVILGALRMMRLSSYGLGVAAAVLAIVPVHPWCVIGLPIGIWALIVLLRGETREAFLLREQQGLSFGTSGRYGDVPGAIPPPKPGHESIQAASARLSMPAVALMFSGVLQVLACLLIFRAVFGESIPRVWLLLGIVPIMAGLFQFKGGWHMFNRQSYHVCLFGTVAAMLPLGFLWAVSMPVPSHIRTMFALLWLWGLGAGIWSRAVLGKYEVRGLFANAGGEARADLNREFHATQSSQLPAVIVVFFLLLGGIVVVFALLGWFYVRADARRSSVPAEEVIMPVVPDVPNPPVVQESFIWRGGGAVEFRKSPVESLRLPTAVPPATNQAGAEKPESAEAEQK